MPNNTATAHKTAGITFKIGGTTIAECYSTPDMGSEPAKIDVTSFDDTVYKKYIKGLMDVSSFNFDFWDIGTNYAAALAAASSDNNTYSLTYPDGSGYTWSGEHTAFKLASNVGDAVKFRISCTVYGAITPSGASSGSS